MGRTRIHGVEHPIKKVFSNDFAFSIPLYQRPYAWIDEQAGELFDDLVAAAGEDDADAVEDLDPYFLGSVVLVKEDTLPESEVVDGQQRLTTLTILLSALRYKCASSYAKNLTKYLYEEGNEVEGTKNRYRLRLRERDAEFFRKYVQDEPRGSDGKTLAAGLPSLVNLEPKKLTDSQRCIQQNAQLFLNRLDKMDEAARQRLAKFIVLQCFLVVVWTPDLESAYRIFSVLNDRGLDLSHADILKAEILGSIQSEEEQSAYGKKWEALEEDLGRDGFKDLFAHVRMIARKDKARDTLLKEVREFVKPAVSPKNFIDETLIPLGEALAVVRTRTYESTRGAEQVNTLLDWLNRIDNYDWVPPAISYVSRHSHDSDSLIRFLTDLERLAAGLMIYRADINVRIERYGQLLTAIENGNDLYVDQSPLQLSAKERLEIMKQLDGDLYEQKKIRLYVLLRLDQALSEGEASYDYPIITVEHVLPQTPAATSTWCQWFVDEPTRRRYVHRIGNLALLSRRKNSQAQNYDFAIKKGKYFAGSGGVSPFVLTTQVLNAAEWTPAVIEKRQGELLGRLRQVWRL